MRKSQAGIIGLYISVPVVMALIILFISHHYTSIKKLNRESLFEELQQDTLQNLDVLLRTEGIPLNWSSNASVLGVNKIDLDLSKEKINALGNMTNSTIKEILTGSKYEFLLEISYLNGTVLLKKGSPLNSPNMFGAQRMGKFEDSYVMMRLYQWQ